MTVKLIDGKKNCSMCKELKELKDFRSYPKHSTGLRPQCRICDVKRRRKLYEEKKLLYGVYPRTRGKRTYNRSYTHNSDYKKTILKHYGESCFCCGETNISFLCVDHINDNGKEHGTGKKNGRYKGIALYRFLIKNNYPDGIQIACFNCNIGRRINRGNCPHKGEYQSEAE